MSFIITASITGYHLYDYDGGNYLKFNFISKEVLIDTPGLYNPPYDVFAERSLGGEVDYYSRLPIILTYDSYPRKILADYDNLNLLRDAFWLPDQRYKLINILKNLK